jgi:hypothetical protein
MKSFSQASDRRHIPGPRHRENGPSTLTSKTLRSSSIQLMMQGIKDPAPIGSARNVLAGYDLGKRDRSKTATQWPYQAEAEGPARSAPSQRTPGLGPRCPATTVKPAADGSGSDTASQDPVSKEREDTALRKNEAAGQNGDRPWGW